MKAQVVRQNGCRGIVHLPQEFQDYIGHIAMELYDKKQEMALEARDSGCSGLTSTRRAQVHSVHLFATWLCLFEAPLSFPCTVLPVSFFTTTPEESEKKVESRSAGHLVQLFDS